MKKLLIGFLTLSSLTSFANDYYTTSRDLGCTLSADYVSISTPQTKLPIEFQFDVNVTEVITYKKDKRFVHKRTVTTSENAPLELVSAKQLGHWGWDVELSFKDISKEDFTELLSAMGNDNNTPPKKGLKNLDLVVKRYSFHKGSVGDFRKQVHYSANHNDGLSYHLDLECSLKN